MNRRWIDFVWLYGLHKLVSEWRKGNSTMMVNSNYQDVEITKNGTKFISGIRGKKVDLIIFDEWKD